MPNSNFERIGISRLYNAKTVEDAKRTFEHSCECCCSKGRYANCDQCGIDYTYKLIVALLNDRQNKDNI